MKPLIFVTDVGPYPESPMALEDAQRAMGLVRFHAAAISTHCAKRLYPAVDAADKESCRPDFAAPIYPGHLSLSAAEWDAQQGAKKFVVPHPPAADKTSCVEYRNSSDPPDAAYVFAASGR